VSEDRAADAAYRDAVLWTGALIRLSKKEATAVCQKVLLPGRKSVITAMIFRGFFPLDDGSGALLAIPKVGECVRFAATVLRMAGLKSVASRLSRAGRRTS
jgi:hypothetical protein